MSPAPNPPLFSRQTPGIRCLFVFFPERPANLCHFSLSEDCVTPLLPNGINTILDKVVIPLAKKLSAPSPSTVFFHFSGGWSQKYPPPEAQPVYLPPLPYTVSCRKRTPGLPPDMCNPIFFSHLRLREMIRDIFHPPNMTPGFSKQERHFLLPLSCCLSQFLAGWTRGLRMFGRHFFPFHSFRSAPTQLPPPLGVKPLQTGQFLVPG